MGVWCGSVGKGEIEGGRRREQGEGEEEGVVRGGERGGWGGGKTDIQTHRHGQARREGAGIVAANWFCIRVR